MTEQNGGMRVVASAGSESRAEGRLTGWSAIDWALTLAQHRDLVAALVRRDLDLRFKGSALGLAWVVLVPIALAAVYTYASGVIFQARVGSQGIGGSALSIYLGTVIFQLFSEPIVRASTVIQDQAVFVKKVAIPVRVLPVVPFASSVLTCCASVVAFVAALLISGGLPPATALAAPPILALMCLSVLGACWATAAVAAYVRDLKHVVAFGVTAMLFVTPVFYPASAVPEALRFTAWINPAAWAIDAVRGAVLEGRLPSALGFAGYAASCLAICAGGYAAYRRLQGGFSDVV